MQNNSMELLHLAHLRRVDNLSRFLLALERREHPLRGEVCEAVWTALEHVALFDRRAERIGRP